MNEQIEKAAHEYAERKISLLKKRNPSKAKNIYNLRKRDFIAGAEWMNLETARKTGFITHLPRFEKEEQTEARTCETCGREMSEEEHNYGTDESAGNIQTCLQCYADAQQDAENEKG